MPIGTTHLVRGNMNEMHSFYTSDTYELILTNFVRKTKWIRIWLYVAEVHFKAFFDRTPSLATTKSNDTETPHNGESVSQVSY